ncbi:hypothetical protein HPB47_015878 [Ixodes persulcatus]|uniref:Uncharacterized protein n=1 Tax=Ixodes persulcatus TaxID=34615 RepID=A0AC60QT94_IXOPE|nr:hypothetical protein HPB47_015878 [Ixodes persulcatus]
MERGKAKRGVRRAKNTRFINEATAVMETADLATLTALQEQLTSSNNLLRSLNVEIEDHVTQQNLVEEFTTVTEYDDEATRVLSLLNSKAVSLRQTEAQPLTPLAAIQGDQERNPGPLSRRKDLSLTPRAAEDDLVDILEFVRNEVKSRKRVGIAETYHVSERGNHKERQGHAMLQSAAIPNTNACLSRRKTGWRMICGASDGQPEDTASKTADGRKDINTNVNTTGVVNSNVTMDSGVLLQTFRAFAVGDRATSYFRGVID